MIDVSKIRVGDEVTVRVTVNRTDAGVHRPIQVCIGGSAICIAADTIATHTPKPREFKPGDRVTWGSGNYVYEFVAERGGAAAIWSKNYGWHSMPLSDLRHADESE